MGLANGYRLIEGPPAVDEYLALRLKTGLSPKSLPQGEAATRGSWAAVHAIAPDKAVVGMGRVIGDGGWYFHIVDMAVLPEHQRRGIGDAVLSWLIEQIDTRAPENPHITLLADEPGRRLYERHGFVPTAPGSIGMKRAQSITIAVPK
jgi:ribosomal protein S18 acetylase RimI-like enzyme